MAVKNLTSRLAECCLVQVQGTGREGWKFGLDEIGTFLTTEEDLVLTLTGIKLAIPWEDLEDIIERLELERWKLKRDRSNTAALRQ